MIFQFNGMLLRSAGNQRSVSIPATTLGGAIAELTTSLPDMRRLLLDNSGQLRQAHRVILNGELIAKPDGAMPLSETDRVEFFTSIAGG